MKRLVVDLDHTLLMPATEHPPPAGTQHWRYEEAKPNLSMIERLREYRQSGFTIVIHSSRNMRTYSGNVGLINVHTLPRILAWLDRYNVPYDEAFVGKPWCGDDGFYVDDRAVRPAEFLAKPYAEILTLIQRERFYDSDR